MTSAYTLPDGQVAIAFSGGRTSAFMLHKILEANGGLPDRVVVSFQNTGREMPETLDFVLECADRWGVRVVWLEWRHFKTHGTRWEVVSHNSASRIGDSLEPFGNLIKTRRYLPNRMARFCTAELKVLTATRYCRDHLKWSKWTVARGIRADEKRRVKDAANIRERWKPWHPIFDAGETVQDVLRFWRGQPFDLRLPATPNGKTMTGNCCMCFLKSEEALSIMAREHPDRAAVWLEDERWASEALGDGNGRWYNQRRPIKHIIENSARDLLFEVDGALCQANDGDCT